MKVFRRTENDTATYVSIREGLSEINHAMMAGKKDVREMSEGSTGARITYKDGRRVVFVKVDAPEVSNVVSVLGGVVHKGQTWLPGFTFPACRTGGQTSQGTRYVETKLTTTCKRCS